MQFYLRLLLEKSQGAFIRAGVFIRINMVFRIFTVWKMKVLEEVFLTKKTYFSCF